MRKYIVITGKVQGVGFRYRLYKAAVERNINGWVKNKISGEVEALLIGNDSEINNCKIKVQQNICLTNIQWYLLIIFSLIIN